ncbi:OB-fold domain-containing protein [Burkholderia sp. BCC1993]|uniref:OB-fold domain-containing protein n=1 Tax=Burkholderia sp. BCC1993 TaxID=2817444 RepID=UPI002AB06F7D|nr:OB-fold domain-containing protein [Burkholderia sp. BCC1993]
MSAIAAYGCYVPRRRVPLPVFSGRSAKDNDPERAVAWADEDSITMAVAAASDCLRERERGRIDLLIFATTTYAFAEKQGAVIIARALNLGREVRTIDIAHSLRGGTQALRAALDAVQAGSAREALVVVVDCRLGAPGSELERNGGDAAAAFLVAAQGGIRVLGDAQCGAELLDVWRRAGDRFTHSWEERFVVQHGYLEHAKAASENLRERFADHAPASWQWVLSAPDARSHATLSAQLDLERHSVQTPLFGRVGHCGAADALLQLTGVLASATAGQHIVVVNHGDGAEALLFLVEQPPQHDPLAAALAQRSVVRSLDAYRRARDFGSSEYPPMDDQGVSATVHFRERDENLGLTGQRCACGAPQFPRGRVCYRCGAKDKWQAESFAQREGRLLTYTLDAFFPTPEPPTAVGIVQVDEGPRIHLQIADVAVGEIASNMAVRFVFRCIHRVGLRPNYFWKAVPCATASATEVTT